VTLSSTYNSEVQVNINGNIYELAPGQTIGPEAITPAANGNDVISVTDLADTGCGIGDAYGYFVVGGLYQLTVTASQEVGCEGVAAPVYTVVAVLPHTG
jgi:hypothetical protein